MQNKKWVKYYHLFHNYWAKGFCNLVGISIQIKQKYHLDTQKTYVLCCNHFSSFDNFAIHLVFKFSFSVIAISKNAKIPFYGYLLKKRNILIKRECSKSKNTAFWEALARLKNKESIIIAPEGGIRSTIPPDLYQPFEDGAFLLAIKAQVPIVPFVLHTNYKIVPEFPLRFIYNYPFIATILEPIHTKGLEVKDIPNLKLKLYHLIQDELNSN